MSIVEQYLSLKGVGVLLLIYCIAPYAVLWLGVRCWPKGHPRRDEYLAEYDVIPKRNRLTWTADALIRSLLDGLATRFAERGTTRVRRMDAAMVAFGASQVVAGIWVYVSGGQEGGWGQIAVRAVIASGATTILMGSFCLRVWIRISTRRLVRRALAEGRGDALTNLLDLWDYLGHLEDHEVRRIAGHADDELARVLEQYLENPPEPLTVRGCRRAMERRLER